MRTWFITGCSGGLGNGIARAALAAGENVVMTSRDTTKLSALVNEYPERGYAVYMDLNDPFSMDNALMYARKLLFRNDPKEDLSNLISNKR